MDKAAAAATSGKVAKDSGKAGAGLQVSAGQPTPAPTKSSAAAAAVPQPVKAAQAAASGAGPAAATAALGDGPPSAATAAATTPAAQVSSTQADISKFCGKTSESACSSNSMLGSCFCDWQASSQNDSQQCLVYQTPLSAAGCMFISHTMYTCQPGRWCRNDDELTLTWTSWTCKSLIT